MTELKAKRLARIRDKGVCQLCTLAPLGVFRLHGHHIRPKALFPNLAAEPGNIITLCYSCHLIVVHGANIRDGGDPDGNWRKFVFMFSWMLRNKND